MQPGFYSDRTGLQCESELMVSQSYSGHDALNKNRGAPPFILSEVKSAIVSLSLTYNTMFHTPSLGDEEFKITSISLEPEVALSLEDADANFGELAGGVRSSFSHSARNAMDVGHSASSYFSSSSTMTINVPLCEMSHSLLEQNQLSATEPFSNQMGLAVNYGASLSLVQGVQDQLQISASCFGASLADGTMDPFQQKMVLVDPPVSLSDSSVIIAQLPPFPSSLQSAASSVGSSVLVRAGAEHVVDSTADASVSVGAKKGKKKKDPNEPQKPVSAYALFFRDTQAAIKGQNPAATFGEVSKIVASMWDSLGEEQKQVYRRKTEAAKKEYLKALAAYRANCQSKLSVQALPLSDFFPASSCPMPVIHNPEQNTSVCMPHVTLDLPHATTQPQTIAPNSNASPAHTVTKIIIFEPEPKAPTPQPNNVPASVVPVISAGTRHFPAPEKTAISRQTPPLQQRQSNTKLPHHQHIVHIQPPQQAPPSGSPSAALSVMATPPQPLQIQIVPAVLQSDGAMTGPDASASVSVSTTALQVKSSEELAAYADDHVTVNDLSAGQTMSITPASSSSTLHPSICVRVGCTNAAVESEDWDLEYCSNECVVTHCRDIFLAWCSIKNQNSTVK